MPLTFQAVIHGQQQSKWLRSFLNDKRKREVNIYLEDDHQLDQVYWYLNELYATSVADVHCVAKVKSVEHVPYVLHVLLPEVRNTKGMGRFFWTEKIYTCFPLLVLFV